MKNTRFCLTRTMRSLVLAIMVSSTAGMATSASSAFALETRGAMPIVYSDAAAFEVDVTQDGQSRTLILELSRTLNDRLASGLKGPQAVAAYLARELQKELDSGRIQLNDIPEENATIRIDLSTSGAQSLRIQICVSYTDASGGSISVCWEP